MLFSNNELERAIWETLPFKNENKSILAEETRSIIQANAIGIRFLAIIQGSSRTWATISLAWITLSLYGYINCFAIDPPHSGNHDRVDTHRGQHFARGGPNWGGTWNACIWSHHHRGVSITWHASCYKRS